MSIDGAAQQKLREKFDTGVIGLKPKITCKACSDTKFTRCCDKHEKRQCNGVRGDSRSCGQWITTAHMHVEFVGHADVTDRLLAVDPEWSWEPFAIDQQTGLPKLTPDGGLWIRLTVLGVTRVGYGGSDGKTGDDGVKEAISDALKVTAMRFGIALDLWRKSEVSGKTADDDAPAGGSDQPRQNGGQHNGQRQNGQQNRRPDPQDTDTVQAARTVLANRAKAMQVSIEAMDGEYRKRSGGKSLGDESDPKPIRAFIAGLDNGSVKIGEAEPAGASS